MTIVLDASAALAAVLPDEESPFAEAAIAAGLDEAIIAPALWPYEVQNGLLVALHRKRLDADGLERVLQALRAFSPRMRLAEGLGAELRLSREHNLSCYDAAYLNVALSMDGKLASTDQKLRAAAEAAGVKLFTAPQRKHRR